jgi:hypothetical protein
VPTGKRQWAPERNVIGHTHGSTSSEHAWDPMASSSVDFCRKTRTVPLAAGNLVEQRHQFMSVPIIVAVGTFWVWVWVWVGVWVGVRVGVGVRVTGLALG